MVGKIMADPDSYIEYGEDATGRLMAMQIPNGTEVNKITFMLGDDSAPFYKRPFAYASDTYEAGRWHTAKINGRTFVFFDKPIPKISRRIDSIRVDAVK